jgi:predicted dehydrogenase
VAKFRVGMIGCGGIANRHAQVIASLEQLELVAFCDVDLDRAERFRQQYAGGQGRIFSDFALMFEEVPLDIVYICLPPYAHSHEVELAAARGVHVFIEKPIALDMETANRMVAAVNAAGVKSQVGFMNRFGDATGLVKSMLESGEAGPPGLFIGWYLCNSLHSPWWRDKSKSGGQIVEQIIHTFDLTRFFLGEPVSVSCYHNNLFHREVENFTSEDVSATAILFDSGAVATVAGTDAAIPGQWINAFKLVTQRLTVDFDHANQAVLHHTDAPWPRQTTISSQKDLFLAETLDLLEAIEKDRPTKVPMVEGARSLQLVLAASRAGETRQPVVL